MRLAIQSPSKISGNQTQHPAIPRTTKRAIHPSPWVPATLNANVQGKPTVAKKPGRRKTRDPLLGLTGLFGLHHRKSLPHCIAATD